MRKATSYAEAQTWARRNPGKTVQWDGGEGWVSEGYWCPQRRRFITRGFNPQTGGVC